MADVKKPTSQFDLNNINVDQIIQALGEYKYLVLKLVMIGATCVMIWMGYNDFQIKSQLIRSQISNAGQKIEAIAQQQKAVKNLSDYKEHLPSGFSGDKIISRITAYATDHKVSINSFSPAEIKNMGLYDMINVSLTGMAPSYKAMVLFLRAIEKSSFRLTVDSWSGTVNGQWGEVNFTVAISARSFHQ